MAKLQPVFKGLYHFTARKVWREAKSGSAGQDFDEGSSKLNVERGINDGIEGTVDVAEPGKGAVQLRRHVAPPAVSV